MLKKLYIFIFYSFQIKTLECMIHRKDSKPVNEMPEFDQRDRLDTSPIVWIAGKPNANNGPSGYLKHVYNVFKKIGFSFGEGMSDWLVLWSHDYPFNKYQKRMKSLKPYQKVNHFPGSGYLTNKLSLSETRLDFIPISFQIPGNKDKFLEYAKTHKNLSWVQKRNEHRGVFIKRVEEFDLSNEGSFIQRYISNPFLIDNRKFDIGIYTVLTSISPLRVYIIGGDALFRFCPQEYHPFDPLIKDKYVIGDNYVPMWHMKSLAELNDVKGYSFKNSFDTYLKSLGKDPINLWEKMYNAIREVCLLKETPLIRAASTYISRRNFFEMVRFDFVVDDLMNVYLMEANMSPNLSSDHFSRNKRLYEHVLLNLYSLVGITHMSASSNRKLLPYNDAALVSPEDINVFPEYCQSDSCTNNCSKLKCKLCQFCMTEDLIIDLKIAYIEHHWRGSAQRIFPPPLNQSEALRWNPDSKLLNNYNSDSRLMILWFIGKCRLDVRWCF